MIGDPTFTRRGLALSAGALGLFAAAAPVLAGPAAVGEMAEIEVFGRKVPLYIYRAAATRAVVVFSHGAGADPRGYHRLFDQWTAAGISVAAPVHVDSVLNPDHEKYGLAAAFTPRWREMTASVAWARAAFPGVKTGASGHSYGSMLALMMAGALPRIFGPPKAPVDAVVDFSSAGKNPLIRPDAYAGVTAPFLQFTGDHDVVEGIVSDWHDDTFAYETSPPGNKYLWVGNGVDHNFGGALHMRQSPQADALAEAIAISTLFWNAYLLGQGEAKAELLARRDTPLGRFTHR